MSRGTTAGHRSRTLRRGPAPRAPRRVSGPTRPALAGAGAAVARPPLSLRLGRRAMRVGDARVLDRLVRGRAWIAIVAAALIGIVFMQVSMLKLNAGVSRAVTAADTLERQNSALRADISELDSGERIQDTAAKLGMVTPPAGNVRYLNGTGASAARAAAAIKPPKPVVPVAPTLGAAATGAATTNGTAANGAPATGAAATGAAAASGAATGSAAANGTAATGATSPNGAGPTGAAATGTATNGAAVSGAVPSGGAGAATANGAAATQQQAPTAQQQAPTQQGTATNTAPPATSQTTPAGSVAGGATATSGTG